MLVRTVRDEHLETVDYETFWIATLTFHGLAIFRIVGFPAAEGTTRFNAIRNLLAVIEKESRIRLTYKPD